MTKALKLKISAFIWSGKRDNGKRDISKCFRGEGTLYSLGNGTFYPLGTILSSGNRTTNPLGNGTWETGHSILWDSDHLSSGNREFGNRLNQFLTCSSVADPNNFAPDPVLKILMNPACILPNIEKFHISFCNISSFQTRFLLKYHITYEHTIAILQF